MSSIYINQIQSISLPNKYTKWYCQIVDRAQKRTKIRKEANKLFGYSESHHILPKSLKMGGEKDKENIVFLTAREHFICHWLLIKMIREIEFKRKMAYALHKMLHSKNKFQNRYIPKSKTYELVRVEVNSKLTGEKRGPNSVESNKQRSLTMMGQNSGPKSESHRLKLAMANIGKKRLKESIEKQIKSTNGVSQGPQPLMQCPHCLKEGGRSNMKRYHFENCKFRSPVSRILYRSN